MASHRTIVALGVALSMLLGGIGYANDDNQDTTGPKPDTKAEVLPWEIPVEVLRMQVKYLSAEELSKEAERWHKILRRTVHELNETNIDIWYENQRIEAVAAEKAASAPAGEKQSDNEAELESELKDELLSKLAGLRDRRVQIIDRFNVVLEEFNAKLGMAEAGKEQEPVLEHRRYINAVKSLNLNVADKQSTRAAIIAWMKSSEGGVRLAKNFGRFIGTVAIYWLLSIVLSKLVGRLMNLSSSASQILKKFIVDSVRRITILVGILLGLAALEINITPMIALIGAAGFVIAFALQNTLSNFASGLMIMFYKPFDIGDFVETAEVAGKVNSMTLVTTNIMTVDNKLMVVPNNDLWGKVITNVTGSSERRVDLKFGIGYGDDIALAERVLNEVVAGHPLVLKEPEPVICVAELGDSSVNLICRPWVKTPDYWQVYWDLTKAAKERFDVEGISIPFPQRDVHLYTKEKSESDRSSS